LGRDVTEHTPYQDLDVLAAKAFVQMLSLKKDSFSFFANIYIDTHRRR
jgi:hypothetical protein